MPAISKIRFTNLLYENGAKRFKDDIFQFDGHNGVILLENGGGKTVFVQAAIQAVLPHHSLGERKARDTFSLENGAAHIAIEWILNENPRRYALTALTLFSGNEGLSSHKYAYEYGVGDEHSIEALPFVRKSEDGKLRPAGKEEMYDYYQYMKKQYMNAHYFSKQADFQLYIEENFKIIPTEWKNIVRINSAEGEVEGFFDNCRTSSQLLDRLLIPTVEEVLAGKGNLDFADTFEKQREHFKKHRQLLERIDESRRVQEKMNNYVAVYSRLHQAEEDLLLLKQEVKSLYHLVSGEMADLELALNENESSRKVLEEDRSEWQRKAASHKILIMEQEREKARDEYRQIKAEKDYWQEIYNKDCRRLQNLEIAELKESLRQSEESIDYLLGQLENLDMDQDVLELKNRVEDNSACLRYRLLEAEQQLLGEKQRINEELQMLRKELDELRDDLQAKNERNMALHESRAEAITLIDSSRADMQLIAQRILANPVHDSMEQEKEKWEQRAVEVEKAINDTGQSIKQSEMEKEKLLREIPALRDILEKVQSEQIMLSNNISGIEEKQAGLLQELKDWQADMYNIDSLYLKQSSILERLEDAVEKLRARKEEILVQERQASRMFDLYRGSTYFTADPQVEKWINEWQNQYAYLESGTIYAQNAARYLQRDVGEIYELFPFWAASIICLDNESDKLIQRLEKERDKLSHPLFILGREEARAVIDSENPREFKAAEKSRQVFPQAWRLHLSGESFAGWKEEIEEAALRISMERKEREAELNRLEQLWRKIADFFNKYPYDEYQQLLEEKNSHEDKLFQLQNEIKQKEARREQLAKDLLQLQKNISELKQEQDSLSFKIQQAYIYFQKQREGDKRVVELANLEDSIRELKRNTALVEKRLENLRNRQEDIWSREHTVESAIKKLRDEDLFKELEGLKALFTDKSRETLEIERRDLINSLQKKQQGREQIENKLEESRKNKKVYSQAIERKYRQCKYEIDREMLFPANGTEEINRLIVEIKDQEEKLGEINPLCQKAEKDYERQEYEYSLRKKDFLEKFDNIEVFAEPLPLVKKKLKQEEDKLKQQADYLEERLRNLQAEYHDISRVIHEMEKENGRYDFLLDEIIAAELPRTVKQDFPYKRQAMLGEYIKRMVDSKARVDEKTADLDNEKQGLEIFSRQEVPDIKLREMIINGIKYRDSYDRVIDWQSKMNARLLKIIRIAEEDMREHDLELQQFINRLHTYLLTLARELRLIPKKTRVKVDDSWKEIFKFDVPEWDEKGGKEELRRLVDFMIAELETDRYRNEDGEENYVLVRKNIEKWLQTQQLLRSIMKGNSIKVKCRKVKVDGKINSYFNSWESSNQWSGGEKWSKNMALFLGILNYMAEKRQDINQALPRNRSVILDNPFGRASSEHVLDPVFFIAEQLGFQIIALTALAEGRFVRNYFPVVYSCRLRPTASEDKYIMSREKEINYAFFQDNAPETLKRLGEHKQVELFQ